MIKKPLPYRRFVLFAACAIVIKLFSLRASWVEQGYTYGVYPFLSRVLRVATGWLPFSFGDLLYAAAGVALILFTVRIIKIIRQRKFKEEVRLLALQTINTLLVVYVLFNALWGLNYSRQGIAPQLALSVQPYELGDVMELTAVLQQRLNLAAAQTDTARRKRLQDNRNLFQTAILLYGAAAKQSPFLTYRSPSIKPSLYSGVGHYFGFTGYYNPFSGEAQIKTGIPVFLKPFVVLHEMAHQIGYAKENEANFVAFLAARQSPDVEAAYSVYYHLYAYAAREVYRRDSAAAMAFTKSLHPQVARDNEELKAYFKSTQNPVEPLITRFYDQYLKWNNQAAGMQTYNQVVALLIAYGKKWGWEKM